MRRLRILGLSALLLASGLVASPRPALAAPAAWPTYHQDNMRSGDDAGEPAFTSVTSLWTSGQVDATIYAEPLVVGNTVYLATEGDSVYALDAGTGALIWNRKLGTPVTSGLPCGNINPLGITGTPVIDTVNNVIYVVAAIAPIQDWMFALSTVTGAVLWSRNIDPGGGFDPSVQGQRGALASANGMIYVPFGGRLGDCGAYNGWVVGVPASGTGNIVAARVTGHGGGIWAASGIAWDSAGNLYVATGNTIGSSTYVSGESVIKLSPTLAVLSSFAPSNRLALDNGDNDVGSIGPTILGGSGWIFQTGKPGDGYLINQANLGGIGGAAFTAHVCPGQSSDSVFGGTAYAAPYIYVPCTGGLVALTTNLAANPPTFALAWQGVRGEAPIVAGGVVWTVNTSGTLYGLDPATGATRFTLSLGSSTAHFATPAAGNGAIFVGAGTHVKAFGTASTGPVVSGVSPTNGPAAGGTSVTITGVRLTGATAVKFGATAATNVTVVSDTQVTATSPAGTGTIDVTVTTPSGTSPPGPADQFTYVTASAAGAYHPLAPARILDTRDGTGGVPIAPVGPNGTLNVQVTGRGGIPTTGVTAALLNVTVTNTTAPSFLTVYPAGVSRPVASNLNWVVGQTVPNLVEVTVGTGGQVTVYNLAGNTNVVFDVAGYVSTSTGPDGLFNPLAPARILDTRNGTGGFSSPIGAGQTIDVQVTGQGNVPASGVAAVVLNLTVTGPTASSYLTAFPSGTTRPLASNLNFVAGQTVPNRAVVMVGGNGKISLFNFQGAVNAIADVGGWLTDASNPAATGSLFTGASPTRILDTRNGIGALGPGATLKRQVAGVGVVPAAAKAVVMNVTVTDTSGSSYLVLWPDGSVRPVASDLNWIAGQTVPNLVVVQTGTGGTVDVYNLQGSTDVVMDVVGWYS